MREAVSELNKSILNYVKLRVLFRLGASSFAGRTSCIWHMFYTSGTPYFCRMTSLCYEYVSFLLLRSICPNTCVSEATHPLARSYHVYITCNLILLVKLFGMYIDLHGFWLGAASCEGGSSLWMTMFPMYNFCGQSNSEK